MTYSILSLPIDKLTKEQDRIYEEQILVDGIKIRTKEKEIITEKIGALLTIKL